MEVHFQIPVSLKTTKNNPTIIVAFITITVGLFYFFVIKQLKLLKNNRFIAMDNDAVFQMPFDSAG